MFKSQIIDFYRGYGGNKISMGKNYEKAMEKFKTIKNSFLKQIEANGELKKLLLEYEEAHNELNYADVEDIFREGFIFGARIDLEICGVECGDE